MVSVPPKGYRQQDEHNVCMQCSTPEEEEEKEGGMIMSLTYIEN